MLWLNPTTGDVMDSPKRPSPVWVVIVEAKIRGNPHTVESTLEGLRRIIIQSNTIQESDLDWVEKTGLNLYSHEQVWYDDIKNSDFPYITLKIATDGTLEIRYDENATDNNTNDILVTSKTTDDDAPLKRGGQRGAGKSGGNGGPSDPNGEPSDEDGEPSDEPSDEDGEPSDEPSDESPDEIIDDDFDPDGDTSQQEDRDAYEEGKENADKISDDLKEKMKEKMEGKGKPAKESGPSNGPAPDGSEGGAPAEDPTGEAGEGTGDGQGTPTEGDGGQGDGDGSGGDGDGSGDGDGDGDGDDDSDSNEEGESDSDSEDGLSESDKDALDQCVEEAEDGKDAAEEAMQSADSEESKEAAQQAREAAKEAQEIVDDNGGDSEDQEKADEAEQYAEEAEEFADLAKELEEEIQELFDESGLDDEDFEDFKQGLLDELFGEDSEFSDQLDEKELRLKKKLALRLKNRVKRGTVRCVNWATGKIKSFPEDETIGGKWIPITLFFSPFESDGNQIVVDKTIAGAVEMAQAVGITISFTDKTSADFATTDEEFFLALKRMLMFTVTQKLGGIHINY